MEDKALMIDLGNSRLSWAFYSDGKISSPKSCSYMAEISREIETQWRDIPPMPVYISNVAGSELQQMMHRWFEAHWNISPVLLRSPGSAHGVTNAYQMPDELGVDRWLGLLGARTMSRLPVCVVDCGSAVTIDVMDAGGVHQGGIIIPGYEMMLSSLKRGTAIPAFQKSGKSFELLGKCTSDCIQSGCANTIAAIIERVMQSGSRLQRLFMTGGNAAMISPLLEHPSIVVPDLIFRGIVQYISAGSRSGDASN